MLNYCLLPYPHHFSLLYTFKLYKKKDKKKIMLLLLIQTGEGSFGLDEEVLQFLENKKKLVFSTLKWEYHNSVFFNTD